MYFSNTFTLERHKRGYYKTFQDFYSIVKYYLKRYKNNPDIDITIDKNNFSIVFTGKNNLKFY